MQYVSVSDKKPLLVTTASKYNIINSKYKYNYDFDAKNRKLCSIACKVKSGA